MKNKTSKQLVVGIRTDSDLSKEFLQAWKNAETRNLNKGPVSHLYFDSLDTLWRKLTPRRTELLQALRQKGPLSMRKLAFYLHRDYKNVRIDIKELSEVNLVKKTDEGLFMVPWDSIDLQIPLTLAS
jgi:predicted transcriptional regulator